MQKTCEVQGCKKHTPTQADRFCRSHQFMELRRINKVAPSYFQPLRYRTVNGPVQLSDQPFLLLEEAKTEGSRLLPFCGDC